MAMRTVPFRLRGVVASRGDVRGMLTTPGDGVLVERGRLRLLVILCPSGCGEEVVINLDRQAGPAWRWYSRSGVATLFPSVWLDTGCEAHFILWKNLIHLVGIGGDVYELEEPESLDLSTDQLLAILSRSKFEGFEELA